MLWNFLEHIANIYSTNINRNLLIERNKFHNLKEQISQIIEQSLRTSIRLPINLEQFNSELNGLLNKLNEEIHIPIEKTEWRNLKRQIRAQINNLIKQEDILIEGYDIRRLQEIIVQKIEDFPSIITLINLMCNDVDYNLSEYENRTIIIMNSVRNYLFHRSIRLEGLYEWINEIFEDIGHFNFSELKKWTKKFEELIRKIIAKVYRSSVFQEKREIGPKVLRTYHPTIHRETSGREHFINVLNELKKIYTQQNKFSNIVRLILRSNEKFNRILNNTELIEGCCYGQEDRQLINFQLRFIRKFHFQGRFYGRISFPQEYRFFINMSPQIEGSSVFMTFKTYIYISSLSNIHNIYINLLDFWLN